MMCLWKTGFHHQMIRNFDNQKHGSKSNEAPSAEQSISWSPDSLHQSTYLCEHFNQLFVATLQWRNEMKVDYPLNHERSIYFPLQKVCSTGFTLQKLLHEAPCSFGCSIKNHVEH